MKRAVVLLSGGLDSATTLAEAASLGYACHALTLRYGQRHDHEIEAARRVAAAIGVVEHRILDLDLAGFGGSALVGDGEVPLDRSDEAIGAGGIPVTYVPARNTIFLSYALALAEVRGANELHIGVNAIDYSGYPDCRPAFVEAFERLANLATRAGVEGAGLQVVAPLLHLTKADIVRQGLALGVDYGLTHSCYDPADDGAACGTCDACQLRLAGFAAAGAVDPAPYRGR